MNKAQESMLYCLPFQIYMIYTIYIFKDAIYLSIFNLFNVDN